MTSDPRDLTALTAKPTPNRAASLGGLLGAPRSTRTTPTPDQSGGEAQPQPVADSPTSSENPAEPRQPKPKAPAKPKKVSSYDDTRKQAVPIYLPGPLFAQVKAAAAGVGKTYTDWFLDAYERVHTKLDTVFTRPAPRQSGLPPRKPQRRRVDTPTPVQLRLTGAELAVLDAKREDVGGPSRSEFWTKVAELGLQASAPHEEVRPDGPQQF